MLVIYLLGAIGFIVGIWLNDPLGSIYGSELAEEIEKRLQDESDTDELLSAYHSLNYEYSLLRQQSLVQAQSSMGKAHSEPAPKLSLLEKKKEEVREKLKISRRADELRRKEASREVPFFYYFDETILKGDVILGFLLLVLPIIFVSTVLAVFFPGIVRFVSWVNGTA